MSFNTGNLGTGVYSTISFLESATLNNLHLTFSFDPLKLQNCIELEKQ